MSINKSITLFLIIFSFLLISGCAGIPLATKEEDAIAKNYDPPPDKSYIYVMRENHFAAWAADMLVQVNSNYVGRLRNNNFLLLIVDPGNYTVAVGHPASKHDDPFQRKSAIDLVTLPGKVYFLKGNLVASGHLPFKLLDTEEGKKELVEYVRVNLDSKK